MTLSLTGVQAAELVQNLEGPRLSIPVSLIRKLGGDLQAAALLQQAAFLSSLKTESDFWFDLPQRGEPPEGAKTLWDRLASWEATLGLGPEAQAGARSRIEKVAPGLLEVKKRGIPGRLYYRVSPQDYLSFLSSDPWSRGNPGTSFGISKKPVSRKRGSKTSPNPEASPKSHPDSNKEREEGALLSSQPRCTINRERFAMTELGITYSMGNERDMRALGDLSRLDPALVQEAVEEARAADPAASAWPGRTLAAAKRLVAIRRETSRTAALLDEPKPSPVQLQAAAAKALAEISRRQAMKAEGPVHDRQL